jgi:hypothetical protein
MTGARHFGEQGERSLMHCERRRGRLFRAPKMKSPVQSGGNRTGLFEGRAHG